MRVVAIVLIIVVVVFFGRDLFSSLRVRHDIDELEEQRRELMYSIRDDSVLLRSLDDAEFLERYARENFLMRRDSDYVYILIEK